MSRRLDRVLMIGLATVGFVSRVLTAADRTTEWDSAQLAIGVLHFDVRVHEPHPPGYWLYIAAGRLVRSLSTLDAHQALVLVSAIGSAAVAVGAYLLGRSLTGRWLGVALATTLLAHPLVWFYGSVAGTYAWDAAAGLFALYFATRAVHAPEGGWRFAAASAAAIGLFGGFRPSLIVFLAPLALAAALYAHATVRQIVYVGAAGFAGILVWLVPMAFDQPGGLSVLREENAAMWENAARFTSPFFAASDVMVEATRMRTLGWTVASVLPLLPVAALGLLAIGVSRSRFRDRSTRWPHRGIVVLAVLMVVPQMFSAAFLHFGKSGYVLGWQGALTMLLLLPASLASRRVRVVATVLVAAAVAFWGRQFLVGEGMVPRRLADAVPAFADGRNDAPFRTSLAEIRRVDREVDAYDDLRDVFPSRDTLFVFASSPQATLYRQLSYEAPELELHYLVDGYAWATTSGRRQRYLKQRELRVPPATDIVVVAAPAGEIDRLVREGRAMRVELASGVVVWVVEPGSTLGGVRLGAGS